MIQLIASDLDSTLLAPDGLEMPERNRIALLKAAAMGIHFVVCTGRIFVGGQKFAHFVPGDEPVVCVNGAVVRMSRSLEYLRRVSIPHAEAAELLPLLREAGVSPWFYSGDTCFAERESAALDSLRRRTKAHIEFVARVDDVLDKGADKILAILSAEEAPVLQKRIENHFGSRLYVTRSSRTQVEILAPNATKGVALEFIARRFKIPRENIVAFGDNLNDLELFNAAGIKVAMGNGEDALKSRADIIAPPNDEGGVGQVLEKLLDL